MDAKMTNEIRQRLSGLIADMHGTVIGMARAGRKRGAIATQQAHPTPQRLAMAGDDIEIGDDKQGSRIITMRDSPLERALSRGAITRAQYDMGSKYRHHWYHAGLADNLGSVDLNRIFAGDLGNFSGMAKTEAQVFHRQRYREAVQMVGKIGAVVLDMVVCREQPLEKAGYALGWGPKPAAIVAATERLRVALDQLTKLWK